MPRISDSYDPSNNVGGSGSPVSRGTWIAGTAVALLFLAAAVVLFARFGTSTGARATLRAYDVLSDSSISVSLDVARPKGQTALCEVRAFDSGGRTVADSLVEVPPGDTVTTIVNRQLTTSGRAFAVEVGDCTGR